MIVAGCDVGSLTSKAVVLNSSRILGQAIIKSGFKPDITVGDNCTGTIIIAAQFGGESRFSRLQAVVAVTGAVLAGIGRGQQGGDGWPGPG